MTTTKLKTSAFLVDLYHLSPGSTHTSDFCRLVQNKINHALFNDDPASSPKVQVYLLTSTSDDENVCCWDMDPGPWTLPGGNRADGAEAETFVVRNDSKIASFYRAKQRLDDQEVREIQLLCRDSCRAFWTQVCQLLLTPVHDWSVKALHCCSFGEEQGKDNSLGESEERCENLNCGCLGNDDQCCEHARCRDLAERESLSARAVMANGSLSGEHKAVFVHHHNDSSAYPPPSSGQEDIQRLVEPTLDETKLQVQRFLQTLPSLLGQPEVDRSEVLRGAGPGFVHGYSTRRGGVSSVSTLCSMNVVYTDKKPDSETVVEENRRRLATVGKFNHTNFHITRVEHGYKVWAVGEDPQPLKFDALVTDRRDVTIAAAGADCIVLLFVDPVAKAIGAAHAGWAGTAERVAACVVKRMREEYGCRPEDIRVALGPGVRLGCFAVPKEDAKLFSDIHPDCVSDTVEPAVKRRHRIDESRFQRARKNVGSGGGGGGGSAAPGVFSSCRQKIEPELSASELARDLDCTVEADCVEASTSGVAHIIKVGAAEVPGHPRRPEQAEEDFRVQLVPQQQLKPKEPRMPRLASRQWVFVDLQLANYHSLLQAGVKAEHIDTRTSHCTVCNPELYFSYERDGFPFGNQIGFVCMPSGSG